MNRTALVVGARGVIGGNLVDHLGATGEWNIVGLSRRGGVDSGRSGTWRSTCSTGTRPRTGWPG